MKKLIDFGKSPWPMLLLTALGVMVAVLTSMDWSSSQYSPLIAPEPTVEEMQP